MLNLSSTQGNIHENKQGGIIFCPSNLTKLKGLVMYNNGDGVGEENTHTLLMRV